MPVTNPNQIPSSLPTGLPSSPPQTPPSFGAQLLGNKEFSIEFNDSVLDTKAWRSTRYEGNQLETQNGINGAFREGDKSFGKTPIVERYSRCIYIGKQITPHLGDGDVPPDTLSSVGFKGKTVIQLDGLFQINGDNTITKITNFDAPGGTGKTRRSTQNTIRGAVGDDFRVGSKAKLIVFDQSVEQNLKEGYTVEFNEGSLTRIAEVSQSLTTPDVIVSFLPFALASNAKVNIIVPETANNGTDTLDIGGSTSSTKITLFDNNLSSYHTNTSGSGDNIISGNQTSVFAGLVSFFNDSKEERDLDRALNKFYIQVKPPRLFPPQRFNTAEFGLNNLLIYELDMNQLTIAGPPGNSIISIGFKTDALLSNPFNSPFGDFNTYTSFQEDPDDPKNPANLITVHRLNPNPAIIVDMVTTDDLPNGVGSEGFVIIPDNLHPDIKRDLDKILVKDLGFSKEGFSNKLDTDPFRNNRNNYGGFASFIDLE